MPDYKIIAKVKLLNNNKIKIIEKYNNGEITKNILINLLKNYNDFNSIIDKYNTILTHKKIRRINFMSEMSENIAKYSYYKKYNEMPIWNSLKGDLILNNNKIIEVKCFSSNGPISFSPKIIWDILIFIDANNFKDGNFIVYIFNGNIDDFKKIMVNKNETINDQMVSKRRPRINFNDIKKQIGNKLEIIFNGNINDL